MEQTIESFAWTPITAGQYENLFDSFGGSFAVHPRVVRLVESLSGRGVDYAGLFDGERFIAAMPSWGREVVATKRSLQAVTSIDIIDIGDSEVLLPIASDARIDLPFQATMLSDLHGSNIAGLERDHCPIPGYEQFSNFALAKGLSHGPERHGVSTVRRRLKERRRLQRFGGRFVSIDDLDSGEILRIYRTLYEKRWGNGAVPIGNAFLPIVFDELKSLLFGDVLFFDDEPIAFELLYKVETRSHILVNAVQAGVDPAFLEHSAGSVLYYHNLEKLERMGAATGKTLRYCVGWNEASYKQQVAFEVPAFRRVGAFPYPEPVPFVAATELLGRVVGWVDGADRNGSVYGWALFADGADGFVRLDLYDNGEPVASTDASIWRDDIAAVYGGRGRAGFYFPPLPTLAKSSVHLFDIREHASGASVLRNGIRAINAAAKPGA